MVCSAQPPLRSNASFQVTSTDMHAHLLFRKKRTACKVKVPRLPDYPSFPPSNLSSKTAATSDIYYYYRSIKFSFCFPETHSGHNPEHPRTPRVLHTNADDVAAPKGRNRSYVRCTSPPLHPAPPSPTHAPVGGPQKQPQFSLDSFYFTLSTPRPP